MEICIFSINTENTNFHITFITMIVFHKNVLHSVFILGLAVLLKWIKYIYLFLGNSDKKKRAKSRT